MISWTLYLYLKIGKMSLGYQGPKPVVLVGKLKYIIWTLYSFLVCWLNNFILLISNKHKIQLQLAGTIPAKLLLQLTTAFREGGLRDRRGTYLYKDHLHKSSVPILALAGDQDLICPPEAVEGKIISEMSYVFSLFLGGVVWFMLMILWWTRNC